MKKTIVILLFVSNYCLCAQTTSFDALNANVGIDKAINWTSSTWRNGFGHKIYNADPGGGTQLRIAGRHDATEWTDIMTVTSNGDVGIGTTSPNALLHLHGTSNGMSYSSFQMGEDSNPLNNFHWVNGDWADGGGRALYLFNGNLGSGTRLFSITPSGNFKISGNLEIDGDLTVNGQEIQTFTTTIRSSENHLFHDDPNTVIILRLTNDANLLLTYRTITSPAQVSHRINQDQVTRVYNTGPIYIRVGSNSTNAQIEYWYEHIKR